MADKHTPKPLPKVGRRDVIKSCAIYFSAVATGTLSGVFSSRAEAWLSERSEKAKIARDAAIEAKNLFLAPMAPNVIVSGNSNPRARKLGDKGYAIWGAENAFRAAFRALSESENQVIVKTLIDADVKGNLILIGGPVANNLCRFFMGYSMDRHLDDQKIDKLGNRSNWIGAEYEFILTDYLGGKMPIYSVVQRGKEASPFSPYIAGGDITRDYLLITKIPNLLSRESMASSVYILSGAKSLGTLGTQRLIESPKIMRALFDIVEKEPAWQSLFEIRGSAQHEYISDIVPLDPFPIGIDERAGRTWLEENRSKFAEYFVKEEMT